MNAKAQLTQLLKEAERNEPGARERFFRLVYDELHQMAKFRLRGQARGATLQATALIGDIYPRIFGDDQPSFVNRKHFFFAAARAMRQVVIDAARRRRAQRRGGGKRPVSLNGLDVADPDPVTELISIDQALKDLKAHDRRCAEVVRLRFYCGCTHEVVAELLDISVAKVRRDWEYAQAWLRARIEDQMISDNS